MYRRVLLLPNPLQPALACLLMGNIHENTHPSLRDYQWYNTLNNDKTHKTGKNNTFAERVQATPTESIIQSDVERPASHPRIRIFYYLCWKIDIIRACDSSLVSNI